MNNPSTVTNYSLVFVYGTLKHGFPNWHIMPTTAVYLGDARTAVPYPLVLDTEMYVPYMLNLPRHPEAHAVFGELYAVSEEAMAGLDRFEGVPTGFYTRERIEVISLHEPGQRERLPNPVTGEKVLPGHVSTAGSYFRGTAGPAWALKWPVERLQTLPMCERYSREMAKRYILREGRAS